MNESEFNLNQSWSDYMKRKSELLKFLHRTRLLIDKVNKLGYNVDLNKDWLTEFSKITEEDLDRISFSYKLCQDSE